MSVVTAELPELLDVRAVAVMLGCSARHIYRMADAGRLPQPCRLGNLVRWRRQALLDWLADGCPDLRKGGR